MSDYLSNLTDRTYQRIPLLQPRLASRFETLPTPGALGAAQPVEPVLSVALDEVSEDDMTTARAPALSPRAASAMPAAMPEVAETPQSIGVRPLTAPIGPLADNHEKSAPPKRTPSAHDLDELTYSLQPAEHRPARRQPDLAEIPVAQTTPVIAPPVGQTSQPEPQRPLDTRHPTSEPTLTRIEAVHTIERIIERSNHAQRGAATALATPNPQAPLATRHDTQAWPKPQPPTGIVAQPTVIVAPPPSNRPAVAADQPPRSESSSATTPTIQVTIGRVEVRATPAPALAAKPAAAPSKSLSLEDYLRRRNEGGKR